MKWIKYSVLQNTINTGTESAPNYENIFLEKKIGYSEANLAIAQNEAFEGKYTIEEDSESFELKPLSVELGGTGGRTAAEALKSLGIAGLLDKGFLVHKFNSANESSVSYWRNVGAGIFHTPASLDGKTVTPGDYVGGLFYGMANHGFLINMVKDTGTLESPIPFDVVQYFIFQSGSDVAVYTRNSIPNTSNWDSDWVPFNKCVKVHKYKGTKSGMTNESDARKISVNFNDKLPTVLMINYYNGNTLTFAKGSTATGGAKAYPYIDASGEERSAVVIWGEDFVSLYNNDETYELNSSFYEYTCIIL